MIITKYGTKSRQEQLLKCTGVKYPRYIVKYIKPKKPRVSVIAEIQKLINAQ